MAAILVIVALAGTALAVPVAQPTLADSLLPALRSLAPSPFAALEKRQSTDSVLNGLENLLDEATSTTTCEVQCSPWLSELLECFETGESNIEIGLCACGASQAMRVCGYCIGADELQDANDFRSFCATATGTSSSDDSRSSYPSASAVSRSAIASASASAVRSATAIGAASSTASSTGGAPTDLPASDDDSFADLAPASSAAAQPSAAVGSNGGVAGTEQAGGSSGAGTRVLSAAVGGLAGVAAVLLL
ncbi:hypothetical protein JCM10450v2_001485 [Rhodotorula kratochvilovae]